MSRFAVGLNKNAASIATLFNQLFWDDTNYNSGTGLTPIPTTLDLSSGVALTTFMTKNPAGGYSEPPYLYDTVRGDFQRFTLNSTSQSSNETDGIDFSGTNFITGLSNGSGNFAGDPDMEYRGVAFGSYPKFFKIIPYTGNGTTQAIPHGLGDAPGMVHIKRIPTTAQNHMVWHRGLTAGRYLIFNTTANETTTSAVNMFGNNTITVDPDATNFTVGSNAAVNASGINYIAYVYGHDTGTDGLIQCGVYTGNNNVNGPTVSLGWNPQWMLVKRIAGSVTNWNSVWNINSGNESSRSYGPSNNENVTDVIDPTGTGFKLVTTDTSYNAVNNYIYVAVREPF